MEVAAAEIGNRLVSRSELVDELKPPKVSDTLVPDQLKIDVAIVQREYLVNGELKIWNGKSEKVYSPISIVKDGEKINPEVGEYPWLTKNEAMQALESATQAYNNGLGDWPAMNAGERIKCMEHFVQLIQEKRAEVVKLIVWEIAKTEPDAAKEFDRTVAYIKDSITELKKMESEETPLRDKEGIAARVGRAPLGVVLSMGPFNYPLNETFTTLIPALLMGNTAVVKAPKQGVLLLQPLLSAFRDAFPPGVVNVIYGDGKELITPIMESGKIDSLAFIGSSRVASSLIKLHPTPHKLHYVLGLGAKNPAIVLEDADVASAAKEVAAGALSYNGQRCTALKLVLVHRSIADNFVEALAKEVSSLPIGMPWDKGVKITPLAEPNKVQYLRGLIEEATAEGARVCNDGGAKSNETLFTPAVVYPVSATTRLYNEEQFGPVVPVAIYDSVEEVRKLIAESPFGQQAAIFAKDFSSADKQKLITDLARITGGRVNLNTQCQRGPDDLPFGGRKDSAFGVLSLRWALEQFSLPTVIATKSSDASKDIVAKLSAH